MTRQIARKHGARTAAPKHSKAQPPRKPAPALYQDIYLVTVNENPPKGASSPQISIIAADEYLATNFSALRKAVQNGTELEMPTWHLLAIAFSEAEAHNKRFELDHVLTPRPQAP